MPRVEVHKLQDAPLPYDRAALLASLPSPEQVRRITRTLRNALTVVDWNRQQWRRCKRTGKVDAELAAHNIAGLKAAAACIRITQDLFRKGYQFSFSQSLLPHAAETSATQKQSCKTKQQQTRKNKKAASRSSRSRSHTTTQTKNRECTEEKSGHHSRPCETRVHAAAERRSTATMRAGKRQVKPCAHAHLKLGSPKPAGSANHATRNDKHERRGRSGLITRRNGQSRPIRQASSPRQGSHRIQRSPGVRLNRFPHRPN